MKTYITESAGRYYRMATKVTDYKNKLLIVTTIVSRHGAPTDTRSWFYGTRAEWERRVKPLMSR